MIHDSQQLDRIEHWAHRLPWLGGCFLAFLAAAVNVHFLSRTGISVSHLTGDVTRLGLDVALASEDVTGNASWLLLTLTSFVLGALWSGLYVQHPAFTLKQPYGRAVVTIGVLLLLAWGIESLSALISTALAAGACGFQNGLATHHRGLVLRTTHVTGILTDIGHMIGMKLGGRSVEGWKIGVQALVFACFAAGALCGALLELRTGRAALALLGSCYVLLGGAWMIFKRRSLHLGSTSGTTAVEE